MTAAVTTWLGRPWYERNIKREWVVDAAGGGDTARITDAIARAGDGAAVRIRPGTYGEALSLERPLTLTAADPDNPPVISPVEGPCLAIRGEGAVVTGLSFRAGAVAEGTEAEPCVVVGAGTPWLEGNRIEGSGSPAVLLRDGTTAVLRGNIIASSAAGVVITAGARPVLERNTLAEIAGPALLVRGGAAPLIESNVFEASGAAVFGEGAAGSFRNNTLRHSRATAVEIGGSADPEVVGNVIVQPGESGVYVYGEGRGRVQENRIEASKLSGVVIDGGAPRLIGNQVTESGEHGILVIAAAGGTIDGNTVRNSRRNGIVLGAGTRIELSGNTLQGNAAPQVVDLRER